MGEIIDVGLMGGQHVRRIPSKEKVDSFTDIGRLLRRWQLAHKDEPDATYISGTVPKSAFLPDGIIDDDRYQQAPEKILFIAKEAYWFEPEDTTEKSNKNAEQVMFWHREVAFNRVPETIFSKRLSMLANAIFEENYQTVNKGHTVLQSVAVMNLNKRGGFSYCVWETLEEYVSRYRDFIRREIELIAPTLIVCCSKGVHWLLEKYISLPTECCVVTVSHPSYFALSDEEYLYQLRCAMKGEEWMPKREAALAESALPEVKGIIFDTNKTYFAGATFDMLTSGKISAYGSAGRFINSFSVGDYAFYYVKGRGVVAAGEILSELTETSEFEGDKEAYRMVQMIAPKDIPTDEEGLKTVSPSELKELFGHGFYFASTVKKPYLSKEESERLVTRLKEVYGYP